MIASALYRQSFRMFFRKGVIKGKILFNNSKEKMMKKTCFCFVTFFLFLNMVVSVYAAPTNELLQIGVAQEFETLNPLTTKLGISNYIREIALRPIAYLDAKSITVPSFTKSVPTFENGLAGFYTENGVKKIKAQWEIIESARWGDGVSITGYDVEFAWQVGMNKNVSVRNRSFFNQIERFEIDANNPKKFAIIYKKAIWDFHIKAWQLIVLPKHLEEKVFNQYKSENQGYDHHSLYLTDADNPGLYNGPYVVTEIKLGSHIIFKRNKYFYGNPPAIKKIIVKLIPNTSTMEANLLSGNIDHIAGATNSITFDQALSLEKRFKANNSPFKVIFAPSIGYEQFQIQMENPILKDIRVRRAIMQGIDKEKLVKTFFGGKLVPAIHYACPADPWYTNDPSKVVIYKYSKRQAKKLLKEAGWKLNKADGYRYKNGEKLTIEVSTTSGNKTRETVEVFVQSQLKSIGIEITIKNEPARVLFGETLKKRAHKGMAMFTWGANFYNDQRSFYHASSIPTEKNGWTGYNWSGWNNPEVTKLIDQLSETFSAEKRKEISQKMLYHYTNDLPQIPLYHQTDTAVISTSMKGYKLLTSDSSSTMLIENWKIK